MPEYIPARDDTAKGCLGCAGCLVLVGGVLAVGLVVAVIYALVT